MKAGVLLGSTSSDWLGVLVFAVGLVDQLFQPTSKQVETVEKAFA